MSSDNVQNTNSPVNINNWTVMTRADSGLKDAIYDWINTTKEGVKVAPNNFQGRSKKMLFTFHGSVGKSVMPGEIGTFEVIFRYPPANNPSSNNPPSTTGGSTGPTISA